LEVHEAMDWADLFANRYNVLYDNVLWAAANAAMAEMAAAIGVDGRPYRAAAQDVARKIDLLLWVGPEAPKDFDWLLVHRREWLYPIRHAEVVLARRPYYLPYVAYRSYADRCDVLGNLLAVLYGVADEAKANAILDYLHAVGLAAPYPIRVLYPAVRPGDPDWREYYRGRGLNLPHHYHNGGIWPFVGGFYVAALVRAGRQSEAEEHLARLAAVNRLGQRQPWEFPEWCHGLSGQPMGFAFQTWSAAMYLYAYQAVRQGAVQGLPTLAPDASPSDRR
ncbi:MAG TPA: glycoside hydrolase 100 family protein, partial [Chloroflexota bacterium]